MANFNPFPESEQKAHLRRLHLNRVLVPYMERVNRQLSYFGLPSAQMFDVELWARVLGTIVAVERDAEVALQIYRTATRLRLREKVTVLEMDICEVARLLAFGEREIELSLPLLTPPVAQNIRKIRSMAYDVFNIDLCGGFLYPNKEGDESSYEQLLRNIIKYQARHKTSFILIVTFSTRDAGKSEYDKFICETLAFLETGGKNITELRKFYSTTKSFAEQPPNLRRLRFCVPTYLHKIAYENFEVHQLGAWYYKTYYHSVLYFELRQGTGLLGPWPPVDEVRELLETGIVKLVVAGQMVTPTSLYTPIIE